MDPMYEYNRVTDTRAAWRKLLIKRLLFKLVGEIYVGKRVKLAYFQRWLKRIRLAPEATIMEAGSGDGVFAFSLAANHRTARVLGVELNPVEAETCERMARKEGLTNLSFLTGNLVSLDWGDRFDMIYSLDVLEHIPDDVDALRSLYKALKPGGILLVHVPNRWYMETDGRLLTVPDEEAWRINPGHVRAGYTRDELSSVLSAAGFQIRCLEESQGRPIAFAHRWYARIEKVMPLRVAILPVIDLLTWLDMRKTPAHGNTVWALAQK